MKYRLPIVVIAAALIFSFLSCAPKAENIFENDEPVITSADNGTADKATGDALEKTVTNEDDFFPEQQEEQEPAKHTSDRSHEIKLSCVMQNPELPTGCEVTALTAALNYYGYDVTKTTLADKYLPKGSLGKVDFDEAFVGNPRSDSGFGCFAPVIVKTAQNYLIERTMEHTAWDVSGTDFRELFDYIDDDIPVIVWASMNLVDVKLTDAFYDGGESVPWYGNEHCMVLCGYDEKDNTVTAADPLKGMMKYDADRFETIYNKLEKQAVIIK